MRDTMTRGEAVGLNIIHARKSRGISQKRLGELLDKSREVVGHWETGHRPATKVELLAIADVLDWPYEMLAEPYLPASVELGPQFNGVNGQPQNVHDLDARGEVIDGPWGDGGPEGGTPVQLPLPRAA